MISRLREKIEIQKQENKSHSRSQGRNGTMYRADTRYTLRTAGGGTGLATVSNQFEPINISTSILNSDNEQMTTMYRTVDHQSQRSNDL